MLDILFNKTKNVILTFEMEISHLFNAYYDARKNKRNTSSAIKFEMNYESNLIQLYHEIMNGTYQVKPSTCFINFRPVQREIFAADFRDRIVHHLIYNYISPYFEKKFLFDVYSCRKNKGTHFGIKRVNTFLKACSENYSKDCYVLKVDIKGYFMAMDKNILWEKITTGLSTNIDNMSISREILLDLIYKTLYNDPTKDCIIKGSHQDWEGLPTTKSLFHANVNCGLPIGNLTSQLIGNIYLNDFDHYVKGELGIKYYGRYVDDIVLMHPDRYHLMYCLDKMRVYLSENLKLELHPNKIYQQYYTKGLKFLGTVIKPYRNYIGSRTKGNMYALIEKMNHEIKVTSICKEDVLYYISCLNSYLGAMRPYKTHKLRRKQLVENIAGEWLKYIVIKSPYTKVSINHKKF